MTKKFRQLSLQAKMSSIFILVNLVVFAVTVILILGINSMSSEIDMVYQGNLRLNELSDALTAVQDSMTEYLDSKTSDSLEEFYRSEQIYAQMVQGLSDDVTEAPFDGWSVASGICLRSIWIWWGRPSKPREDETWKNTGCAMKMPPRCMST